MIRSICQKLLETVDQNRNRKAVQYVKKGRWTSLTWGEYLDEIERVAGGLKNLGIQKGDRVAIMSNTRIEWATCDHAILGLGAVTVPIYQSSLAEDAQFILNNSEAVVLFLENQQMVEKWNSIKAECPTVKTVISFDESRDKTIQTLDAFKKSGAEFRRDNDGFFARAIGEIDTEGVATIVYTSGTTGLPKGVVLTHKNLVSEMDIFKMIGVTPEDSSLTFLPFAHILARVEHLGQAVAGYQVAYAENIDKIRANLADIKPTFLIGVPRIYEKIYNGVISQAEASPIKAKIFKWAVAVGKQVSLAQRERRRPSIDVLLQYQLAKKLVFDKFKEKMGGRLRFAVSGGAPLSKDIAEFFHAAGLLILEGYGLTETTAGVFFNAPYNYKFGTVGIPIGDVQCRLAEDGEILVKSDKVMKEYYKNQEATDEVLNDGWFATGDIGELDEQGFLKITDRKKDLIKTAGGKFVAPQKLENLLKLSKYVSNVLIHGDKRKFVVALIAPNFENLENWAKENNLSYGSPEELTNDNRVKELIKEVVSDANSRLASYETVKNFAVLQTDFTVESGELTPSLKVKRKVCDQKYKTILDSFYQ